MEIRGEPGRTAPMLYSKGKKNFPCKRKGIFRRNTKENVGYPWPETEWHEY